MLCKNCGQELGEAVKKCPICDAEQEYLVVENFTNDKDLYEEKDSYEEKDIYQEKNPYEETVLEVEIYKHQKSRLVAGLLQIFLGGFGVGRFYLGYTGVAVGQLCTLPLFGIGYIWGFIDGILILCGQLDLDAEGVPLRD